MSTQQRADFWHEQIRAWQVSGLSGQAFCKQHDLSYHRFVYWRKKQQDTTGAERPAHATGFAQVTTRNQLTGAQAGLTLSLPNGMSISGLHADNIGLLGTILEQL